MKNLQRSFLAAFMFVFAIISLWSLPKAVMADEQQGTETYSNCIPVTPPVFSCSDLDGKTGWYGEYFDYLQTHPQMELPIERWNDNLGDPKSASSTWLGDWYDSKYFKFARVDSNLLFGENFFPVDAYTETPGYHNFHFGVHWMAKVTAPKDGDYSFSITSDDDSWVYADGQLVLSNAGVHPPQTKIGSISFTAGVPKIIEVYFAERRTGGSYLYFTFGNRALDIEPYAPQCIVPPPPVNTPPLITLLGSSTMEIFRGDAFTDPGATSTDLEDGDLTSKIVKTGTVDSSVVGTYTLVYSVTDSGGLSASTTRTVVVKVRETPPPPPPSGGGGGGGIPHNPPPANGPIITPPPYPIGSGSSVTETQITPPSQCNYLLEYLKIGEKNNPVEVLKLQTFLKDYEGFSNLKVTGVFDQETFDAVSSFQKKYSADVLSPWGLDGPTGYVYITTKKKINEIYCKTPLPLTTEQLEEINAFKNSYGGNKKALGEIGMKSTGPQKSSSFGKATTSTSTLFAGIKIEELIPKPVEGAPKEERVTNRFSLLASPFLYGFVPDENPLNIFGVVIIFLFGLLIYGIYRYRENRKKKQEEKIVPFILPY